MARRRTLDRDPGLLYRMGLTVFLLGIVNVVFFVVLAQVFSVGLVPLLVIALLVLGVQYFSSDKIALASSGAREVSREDQPELHAAIERLCMTADLPMPKVALIETDMPNAFATGRSPKHAAVAVTTGLLRRLEPEELEGVLAHELSHVKHRDVAVMTIASFMAMVAGMITRWGFFFGGGFGGGFGGDDDRDSAQGFMIALLVSIAVYAISFVLIRTLSRYREFAADRGAAVLTKAPSALASALVKISGDMARIPQRDLRSAEGLNQFFIIPVSMRNSLSSIFATHPPVEARLARLRELERQLETL